jgi:hypothetical protein
MKDRYVIRFQSAYFVLCTNKTLCSTVNFITVVDTESYNFFHLFPHTYLSKKSNAFFVWFWGQTIYVERRLLTGSLTFPG